MIDHTQQDFTEGDETYDGVFDAVDKLFSSRAKRPLRKTDAYLNVNRDSGSGGASPEDLVFLTELIETGKVRTVIDRRYRSRRSSRPTSTSRRGTSEATQSSPCRSAPKDSPPAALMVFASGSVSGAESENVP